jgi:hypothetical protein
MSGLLRSVYGSEGVESGGGEVKLKVEKRGSHITIELTTDTSKAPIFVKTTEGEIESFKLLWEAMRKSDTAKNDLLPEMSHGPLSGINSLVAKHLTLGLISCCNDARNRESIVH